MSDIPVDPTAADATASGRRPDHHHAFTGAGAASATAGASAASNAGLNFTNGDEGILAALAAVSRTDPRSGVSPGGGPDSATPFSTTAADINAIFAQPAPGANEPDVDPALPDQMDGGDDQDGEQGDSERGGKGKIWACNVCGRVFTRRFNCTTHEKTHLDQRDYPCSLCPRAFTRRHDLERHINSVHPGHYVDKSGADGEDGSPVDAADDVPTLPAVASTATGKRGRRRASRDVGPREVKIRRVEDNELVTSASADASAAPAVSSLPGPSTADHAPAAGTDLSELQIDASLLNTGPETPPAPASFDPAPAAEPSTSFDNVGGDADTNPTFRPHANRNSTNGGRSQRDGPVERVENLEAANPDGDKVFKVQNTKKWACGSCGRMFVRRNNCKAHEMTHRDVRDYPCVVCGRAFSRRHDLERHQSAVHPGYTIPERGSKGRRGGRKKKGGDDGEDDEDDEEEDEVEEEVDTLMEDVQGTSSRPGRAKQKGNRSTKTRTGRPAGGGSELEEVGELDEDEDEGPTFGRPNRAGRRNIRLRSRNNDEAPQSPTTAAVAALAEGVAAASRGHQSGVDGTRGFSIEDFPESNLRGGRDAGDASQTDVSATGDKGDGDLPASVLDQIASIHHGQISYDQAQALRALLASRAGLTSTNTTGSAGDASAGAGNIDPSLEALGGPGPSLGDFPATGTNNGISAGGVGKDHSQHGSHHAHSSGLTSSAAAALAALTSMDFSSLQMR